MEVVYTVAQSAMGHWTQGRLQMPVGRAVQGASSVACSRPAAACLPPAELCAEMCAGVCVDMSMFFFRLQLHSLLVALPCAHYLQSFSSGSRNVKSA